ncbi:pirin-like C-terminal cupin domain-containing protein, partial [Guyparkeria sp. 1SP6A2]|nr:pirin-like C-terminal cupin domain-containing protein [Guyparkeria sp. 1SP6A2]
YRITVLAGSLLAHTSPVEVFTPLCGADFTSSTAARTELPLEASFEYGVLVLEGKASVNGTELEPGHLAYLPPDSGRLN